MGSCTASRQSWSESHPQCEDGMSLTEGSDVLLEHHREVQVTGRDVRSLVTKMGRQPTVISLPSFGGLFTGAPFPCPP